MERTSAPGRLGGIGRASAWLSAIVVCTAATATAGVAAASVDKVRRQLRGQIVFQAEAFPAFEDEKAFAEIVGKARKNKTLPRGKEGTWSFHFLAFLKQPPRASKINLVWYKLEKKATQVDYTEFVVDANEAMFGAQTALGEAGGFKAGDRLEARLTRLIRGREVVYARCRLTLE